MLLPKACQSKYERRRPELTPTYKILQAHLNTFVANRAAEGRPLPDYVIKEFEAFMRCGIPAYGFLKVECSCCGADKIVAFSCKKRGFCPSCCAKRMAEAATHLVENVLPHVAYRQFVISFPIPMRYWLHANKKLYSKIHGLVIKELHRYYTRKASVKGLEDTTPGSISFTQRWGSALNLNPHIHVICPDGVYSRDNGKPMFHKVAAITDTEVADLIGAISQKAMRFLKKRGYLDNDGEVVMNPLADALFEESASLRLATQSSIAGKIAFGPNAGKYVTRIGSGFGYSEETPLAKGRRCFSINGFSLHANTGIKAQNRDGLRKLIEYIARGPLSNERLTIKEDGNVQLQLKSSWSDGTSHLLFTPEEFIEKLAALVPPPRSHLVRWAGVFAPNSPFRQEITLKPKVKKGFQFKEDGEDKDGIKNYSWSKMLAQVFKIDVSKCDICGGDMVARGSIMSRDSIIRYLKHIGLDSDPPPRAPAVSTQSEFDFDQIGDNQYDEPTIYHD